jgi:hypothetical protein
VQLEGIFLGQLALYLDIQCGHICLDLLLRFLHPYLGHTIKEINANTASVHKYKAIFIVFKVN